MSRSSTTFNRGHKAMGGRATGSLNRTTLEVREFARHLIEEPEYQASLRRRMIAGKAPQMEVLLFNCAYGKSVERHEANASARAAGPEGSERRGSETADEDHSGRNLKIHGGEITPEDRERLRRIMQVMEPLLTAVHKERAKARAAGESCLARRRHRASPPSRRRPIFVQFFTGPCSAALRARSVALWSPSCR